MLPSPGVFVGPWYSWWPGDPVPTFAPLAGFAVDAEPADDTLATLLQSTGVELTQLRRDGNHPYVATVNGTPVACGWSAWSHLEIGELDIDRDLPPGNRYLWRFVTAERWRGRSLYPRLLATIVQHEGAAARYWIGHEPDNRASARGIVKAGFQRVGKIYRDERGDFALEVLPGTNNRRAAIGAKILGAYLYGAGDETRTP